MADESPQTRRVRVVISGRVQNVFFRATLAEVAHELGLSGWVTNKRDGSVEAEFEGGVANVERAIRWCHDGPPRARVDKVECFEEAASGERGFSVR